MSLVSYKNALEELWFRTDQRGKNPRTQFCLPGRQSIAPGTRMQSHWRGPLHFLQRKMVKRTDFLFCVTSRTNDPLMPSAS